MLSEEVGIDLDLSTEDNRRHIIVGTFKFTVIASLDSLHLDVS